MRTKEIAIWIIVVVILIGGLWFLVSAVNSTPSPSSAPVKITGLPAISDKDFVRGDASAKVTLVEYGDFQCPACGAYYPIIKTLETDFSKDLQVVYRFFPLVNVHQNAMLAAEVAYSAGLQNKFWEMHDMLYENQNSWANSNPKNTFVDYAKKLNLDLNKFQKDMDADTTKNLINDEENTGTSIGINSTPTFFINGKHIQNPTNYDEFKKLIQDEINKK